MQVFLIHGTSVRLDQAPQLETLRLPEHGFLWLSCSLEELKHGHSALQATLQRLCGVQLVDLHVSDLLNEQLPSSYDFTSDYDLLVFRRLAEASTAEEASTAQPQPPPKRGGPPILRRIDTSAVGFVVFDRVLLSVHPEDGALRDSYVQRLLSAGSAQVSAQISDAGMVPDGHSAGARGVPGSPADLMLRIVSHMVDGFLALRRELSRQLERWQTELINPRARFANWSTLLDARKALHQLDDICDDQRDAMQDWTEALKTWSDADSTLTPKERDMLQVRSRDVLEHIDRVVQHVRQLEQNAETAVQIHFNAQSHRANEIMRTLTVLTAIFLPLNLIAGIFGMNFDSIPLLNRANGFWLTLGAMGLIAGGLALFFWRKRYLERSAR
ncbi:magnesium transporter CorA family protein [Rhodoferax antarcticus]|uniref:CorA-like Mg/Co/Ni transporter family protein n=1 Tax=Rhodoferax antarcticus ANT.BR TaxID=1111071 RepID=A0A1Q8YIZ8_9BURK|nr:magnesium transporter CorA family protein [Rhodoferax antarcticus]APW48056.1 magnesium transporter CorA [Rhodoferax antarcticus]MCW2313462.1 Mg2+ and Co2+ transporter CorA [Rhodoferax antarcticus]OLP07899.1 corA-like Mg/Co/Ni transporter family protein [Rhodoferax antarcticus ANT.BR]